MGLFDKIFKRGKTAPAKLAESIVTPEDEAHGAKRIAEYKSIRELGTGAEGYVMEMVHVPTGKHYAVKAVRRHGDRKPKDLELLQKLRHPNIIELHDWIMVGCGLRGGLALKTTNCVIEMLNLWFPCFLSGNYYRPRTRII